MFRIYGSTLGPLMLALAITAIYYLIKKRRHAKEIPGPPGSIEYIRWRASQEDTEESDSFRYVYVSNWILIANTVPPIVDYARLVIIMFGLLVAIAGLRQIIRGSRKKETKANENKKPNQI